MHNLPFVSIGMPVYNGEKYLKATVLSILGQTYKNFELIISDDNSTDSSVFIIQKFKLQDQRIKLVRQSINIGYSKNFNQVLKMAKGKYFCWSAQDDLHHKNFLKTLVNALENDPSSTLAMCDYRNLHGHHKYKIYATPEQGIASKIDSLRYYLKTVNLSLFYGLYRTRLLKQVGGYHEDIRPYFSSSDFLMIYKTLLLGRLNFTNKILFYKRDTGLFTDEFKHLTYKPISEISKKMLRFALFPIHYIFDFSLGSFYLMISDLRFMHKTVIFGNLAKCTFRLFCNYFIKSAQGIPIIAKRLIK